MYGRLKSLVVASVLIGLGATSVATAADLPVKARPMPAAPLYNWTGCYLGGNVGGGWTRLDTARVSDFFGAASPAIYGREKDSGFIGGGQVGCDFQTGNLVFGVGGSFDFGSVKGSHALTDFPTFSEANNLKEIYTATGRIGYLWTPQLLGYLKGGAAWIKNRNQVFAPGGAVFESASFYQPGMTIGIGAEWMFAPNWSVFAEYNYMWFLDDNARAFTLPGGGSGEVIGVQQRASTALVGVNYKFHWDGPVVAKY
ncbi:outer membrane beta-barrel protein [Bradyrhizobium sp. LTSP849]|jgi:outer membrane immunogenic protein|uniref:outer membrane protein n=2 Tax=unclassified Bradyrhizobium TaxID=2631580 RepID=UPI0009E1B6C0|nr:outer membrane beta-barrel protein [Bradyrhizobium sp. LTSP849]